MSVAYPMALQPKQALFANLTPLPYLKPIAKALTEKNQFTDIKAYKSLQEKRSWTAFCKDFIDTFIKT